MKSYPVLLALLLIVLPVTAQQSALEKLLADSVMKYASVSFAVRDCDEGKMITEASGLRSLTQASVLKLVTTAAAVELLGPDYTFTTRLGYAGILDKKKGVLTGDIVVTGGGDPALGSENFKDHYGNVIKRFADDIYGAGIRKVKGRIIVCTGRYKGQAVNGGWLWEDIGNYYGAGPSGLSFMDNTVKIHFKTGNEGTVPVLTATEPAEPGISYITSLRSSGADDMGYVYSAPGADKGLITGTIPTGQDDFILKASMPDPAKILAGMLSSELSARGIKLQQRDVLINERDTTLTGFKEFSKIESPKLADLIIVLNNKSVNLYAEHLLRELGLKFTGEGSTESGLSIINNFLDSLGIETHGAFIADGSGLSPHNSINSAMLSDLLIRMKKQGRHFNEFYASLPEGGKTGTLKTHFTDPVFESALRAKSGSMTRVRSYAGYLTGKSGNSYAFSIIINNFEGSSSVIISLIENLLKEFIINH